MKPTDNFKKTIEAKLQEMAAADQLFAASLQKEGKNIDDCITYILNTVQKSKCNGFTDDEIFGMAAHYYDEEKIEVGSTINCQVVVNHTIELTEEEKTEARNKAKEKAMADELERMRKKQAPKKAEGSSVEQPSLF